LYFAIGWGISVLALFNGCGRWTMEDVNRSRRALVNAVTAVSLLCCAGVAAAWALSNYRDAFLVYFSPRDAHGDFWEVEVDAVRGRICLGEANLPPRATPVNGFGFAAQIESPTTPLEWSWVFSSKKFRTNGLLKGHSLAFAGFYWETKIYSIGETDRTLAIPGWFLILFFMVLPVRWLRSRKVKRDGLCIACGYDLRATPDRCPECGQVVNSDN
jgi:hypothetical protein